MAKLIKNQTFANLFGAQNVTIPAGTRVHSLKGTKSVKTEMYVVSDINFLITLTGNSHDPKYRYCFVDSANVAE